MYRTGGNGENGGHGPASRANPLFALFTPVQSGLGLRAIARLGENRKIESHDVEIEAGRPLRLPPRTVTPGTFYRLALEACATGPWRAWGRFENARGEPLPADSCCGLPPAPQWHSRALAFWPGSEARTLTVSLEAGEGRLRVRDVAIQAIGRGEVAAIADALLDELPPPDVFPTAGRWGLLPRTHEILRRGGVLRVVMLGDSIVNDTANSHWPVIVERAWPGVRIDLVVAVRDGGRCDRVLNGDALHREVLDHTPDLVMLGGISTPDAEAMRAVVRRLRVAGPMEIMLLGPAAGPGGRRETPESECLRYAAYDAALARMARDERAAYVDMLGPWRRTLERIPVGGPDLYRDPIHASEHGRQILGRTLAAHLMLLKRPASSVP